MLYVIVLIDNIDNFTINSIKYCMISVFHHWFYITYFDEVLTSTIPIRKSQSRGYHNQPYLEIHLSKPMWQ